MQPQTGCSAVGSMRSIHNKDKRLSLGDLEGPQTTRPFFDATNGPKNESLWLKCQLNSSQQPAPHLCAFRKDFGLKWTTGICSAVSETAAQARLPQLNSGQIDFGHIYCSLSIQFADGSM